MKVSSKPVALRYNPEQVKRFLNLAGGIPIDYFSRFNFHIEVLSDTITRLEIKSDVYEARIRVDEQNRAIVLSWLEVELDFQRKGIAKMLLHNMIQACRNFEFRQITLYAAGGWNIPDKRDWAGFQTRNAAKFDLPEKNGHYSWARLGFFMDDDFDEEFKYWLTSFLLKPTKLPFLLKSDELVAESIKDNLRKLWRLYGFGWTGYFDVTTSSESIDTFLSYLIEKPLPRVFL